MEKRKDTLCWYCKNAVCGCSWARFFIPVKGWVAEPTLIQMDEDYIISSFNVKSCPKFISDSARRKTNKVIAAELGISERTLYRRKLACKKSEEYEAEKE